MALTSNRAAASAKASSRSERRPSISLSISCSIACIWLFNVSQTCCSVRPGSGYTDGSAATTILHNDRVEHRGAQGVLRLRAYLPSAPVQSTQPCSVRMRAGSAPELPSGARSSIVTISPVCGTARGYERSTKHDAYLGVGHTWYWCVPWEGSTAGAMELALEHSRHLPGASLRLRFSAVAQVGSRQTKRTRGSDSTEFEMRAGGTRSADTGSELGTWSLRNPCLLIESIDARLNGSGCSICLSRSCAAGEGGCGPRSNDQRLFRMLSYVASSVPSVAWNGGIPQSRVYLKGRAVVYGPGQRPRLSSVQLTSRCLPSTDRPRSCAPDRSCPAKSPVRCSSACRTWICGARWQRTGEWHSQSQQS